MALRKPSAPQPKDKPKRPKLTSISGGGESTPQEKGHLSLAQPSVYDPDSEQPITGPNLNVLQGGGESTPGRGDLHAVNDEDGNDAEDGEDDENLKDAEESGSEQNETKAESSEKSALKEDNEGQIGEGYKDEEGKSSESQPKTKTNRKRNALLGGGITGAIIGALIFAFLSLVPLKVLSLVNTLQDHYFSANESALNRRTQVLFDNYLKKHLLPNMTASGACSKTSTITKDCYSVTPGANPAFRLFSAWREGRFENKLAKEYGIEFIAYSQGGSKRFTLKMSDLPDTDIGPEFLNNTVSLEDTIVNAHPGSTPQGTAEFRKSVKAALKDRMEGATKLKRAYYRFKVGRLLEKKMGIRRCTFECSKTADRWDDAKADKKNAAKLLIVRRVVEPHSQIVGLALGCIISDSCSSPVVVTNADGTESREDGLQKQITAYLDKRSIAYGDDTVAKLLELIPEMKSMINNGLTSYIIETVLTKLINEKVAASATPVVGWIDFGAKLVNTVADAGPKIRRYAYVAGSTAMVAHWMMYRTSTDELKSGRADAELVGALNATLGDDTGEAKHQDQPAEISPLYTNLISPTPTSPVVDLFTPNASAEALTPPTSYICDNNKPIAIDKLVCPEESLQVTNFATAISDAFNEPPLSLFKAAAEFWRASGGFILSQLNGLLSFVGPLVQHIISVIPGISQLQDQLLEWTGALMQTIANYVIPSPISPSMSGARAFDMMAGGADAAASAEGQDGMGGQLLTPEQTAELINDQASDSQVAFASKSVFHRMFDTSDTRSLVSKVALSLPNNSTTAMQSSFASLIKNPFAQLIHGFGSFFAKPRLFAAAQEDPFGIAQFGYALDDPMLNMNPDILTDAYCKNINDLWVDHDVQIDPRNGSVIGTSELPKEGDPVYGIDVHRTTNPCLLEQTTSGSAGAVFDASVLSKGDVVTPTTP